MGVKLGELLISEGLITKEQLEEALKCQVIFGIKLGSSLIEMGFVDESEMVKLLSKKLGVPAATRKDLQEVPFNVYNLLSAQKADQFRVVPFRLENRRLSVAMSDPTDFKVIDELSFITGHIIQPFITPDIYLSFALERYYQIRSRQRYVRVGGNFKRPVTPPVQEDIEVSYEKENGELLNIAIPAEFVGFGSLPDLPEESIQAAEIIERYTIDQLSLDFSNARERDEIADVFIKYLGQEFDKGGLFIVRGDTVLGWRGISGGLCIEDFDKLSLALKTASVLKNVVEESRFFMGPLPATPGNTPIISALKLEAGDTVLVIPIIMLKKMVAIVIVSADVEALGKRLHELHKLVHKASLAFEVLIIRNKILMT
ncbi:MAG TPA: hypothetical protein HPP76_01635 [Desulfuromonadales bacterium]|nr:hypothetical protein [Desulfuromonadales bacterium]